MGTGHEVVALVTQPDKEKGRGRGLAPPPLKPVAEAHGVPVLQPRRIRLPEAEDALRAQQSDIHVVVAYGQILPRTILDIPPRGTVNVHGSLLPKYRGAAPIQWAIVRGETETGVTTMLLDEGMDTGPTLLARTTPIGPEETAGELESRLARLGADVLLETLHGLEAGAMAAIPQDDSRATLAPILKKEDGRIDWSLAAEDLARRVRGFQPWPGATASFEGRPLQILRATPTVGLGEPGAILSIAPGGIVVAAGEGTALRLIEVHPESRRPMTAVAFAAGARLRAGQRFG